MTQSAAIEKVPDAGAIARQEDFGISVEQLVARVDKIKEVQRRVMKQGVHFGKIPGVDKPSLLKPGAEIICMTFQLDPQFAFADTYDGDHLECVVTCTLYHAPSGARLGSGVGSCSTKESRYAYRKGERKCPKCGQAAIIKGKEQYGGGWLCWNKPEKNKNGCGAKFRDGDQAIEGQMTDRVPNVDLPDLYNTVRKMACKRAHVAAALFVSCASEVFTQDVEDLPPQHRGGAPESPEDDEPRQQGRNGNGNGNGKSARQPAPANDAAPEVPSDAELDRALAEIAAIDSVPGLSAHARANRSKGWNKVQIAALKAASEERHAQLTDPEFRDEAPDRRPEPPEHVN